MSVARGKQAVKQKAKAKKASKDVKQLKKAARKMVDDKAPQLAMLLFSSSFEGDVPSTRLLMELAQKNVEAERARKIQPLRSWASGLAAEPEWRGEASEEDAETGVGSREPEGS
jgi:aspartokinase